MSVATIAAVTGIFSDGTTLPSGLVIPNVSFTGNITGADRTLAQSGIPLIGLSSGSVSAAGAISGITALPLAYPAAYCYFPANALATSIAAGWYYCTFSTTTAGTAYLNTWDGTSVPAIPASPTAVTDGKGAFTGDTSEEAGPMIALSANALGKNGRIIWEFNVQGTNNANSKIVRGRWSGTSGTVLFAPSVSSNSQMGHIYATSNAGATNSQSTTGLASAPVTLYQQVLSSIDSTAATTLVLAIQRGTATDNLVIASWRFAVSYSA